MPDNKSRTIKRIILALMMIALSGGFVSTQAQVIPDEVRLPDAKGSWMIFQDNKTSIGGAYLPGHIYVIAQSDGKVFHRKFLDSLQPATPWCQDNFTTEGMRDIKSAVASSKPETWDSVYGPFLSILGPYRAVRLFIRDANGKSVEYKTTLFRFHDIPAGLADLLNATDAAGDLAFSRCAKSLPDDEADKIENGATIYAVNRAGDLLWYNHSGFQNGVSAWANHTQAKEVGHDWAGNVKIFKGNLQGKDGVIYTVSKEGYLTWYKHNGYASGSTDWVNGKNVNINFNGRQVFAGGGGIIYLLDNAGDLYWYKHLGYANGDKTWANNGKGIKVSDTVNNQWKDAQFVFSGGDGVIYLIDASGNLYWQKHLGFQDGTPRWSGQKKIGNGWQNLRQVFSIGDGIIYALKNDGTLLWQKHEGFANGAMLWAKGGAASTIGSSWNFIFVF